MNARRGDEAAVFQVVEAIFVAVLVASALIFFALVQKPTPSPQGAGLDLARVAGDALGILYGDGTSTSELSSTLEPLLEGGTAASTSSGAVGKAVRDMFNESLPAGLRYQVRASVQTTTGIVTAIVHGPTPVDAEPRNAQGAVRYILDADAVTGAANEVVLVELVVWNAF